MQSQFTHVKQKRELQSQILPLKNNLTGILLVSLLVVMFVKAKQAPTTSIFKGEPLNWHLIESYISSNHRNTTKELPSAIETK